MNISNLLKSAYCITPFAILSAICAFTGTRPALAAGPFGINIATPEFADTMKSVRDWGTIPGGSAPTRDANGWPTSDAEIVIYDDRVNMPWNGPDPAAVPPDDSGTYHLIFNGQATIAPDPGGVIFTVANQVYTSSTNTTAADIVVPSGGVDLCVVEFTNTKRTSGSATNTGITNASLTRPGYSGSSQTFSTRYLNLIAPFSTLRFMDSMSTNNYPTWNGTNLTSTPWSQRRLTTDSSQTDSYNGKIGIAWEYAVQLANTAGKDMWINVPDNATDDYVTQLATLIKSTLNSGLHVYVEYSNEVWNYSFQQATWNKQAAINEVNAGGSPLNNDGSTDQNLWASRRYAKRTMEISNLFKAVYGAGGMMTTVRPVMGWQEGASSYYATTMPWIESTFGAPKSFYYGFGNATYFNPTDYTSVANVLSTLTTSANANYSIEAAFTTIAAFYGVANVAYEGGSGISDTDSNEANGLAASRNSAMEGIISNSYLNDWYAAGGGLACYYDLCGAYSPANQWGLLEGDLSKNTVPKYLGAKDVGNAAQPAVTAGIITSTTVNNQVTWAAPSYFLGSSSANVVTAGDGTKYLWGPGTGNYFDYLINVPQSGTYGLILNVGSTQTNGQATYIVDDATIASLVAVPNTGGTETWASMAAVNVTLSAGLHDFRVYVATGIPANHLTEWGLHNIIVKTISLSGGAPPAPTGLTATAGNAQVALSWTASTGATSYNVLRSTMSGSGYASVVTGVAVTSYTNTGLTNGTAYYYVVTATSSGGTSGNSNQASATPQVAVPAAPTGLSAASSNAQVALSWSASSGATAYDVKRSTVSGSGYVTVTSPTVTYFTNTGLTNGTTYYFVVDAKNAAGTSANSAQVSGTPSAGGTVTTLGDTDDRDSQSDVPAGTNPTISASQYDISYFKFTVSGITGTVTNAKLRVYRQDITKGTINFDVYHTLNDTWVQSGTVPGIGTVISTVSNGAIGYVEFDVTSYVTGQITGDGIASFGMDSSSGNYTNFSTRENASNQPQLVITTTGSIPPVPTGLTATPGNTQVALSWNASSGATAYDVKRSTVSGSGYAAVSSPTTTSYTNTGLTNGTTYYFVVDAKNATGSSANSAQVSGAPYAVAIKNTTTAPVIDGTVDAVWSSATAYTMANNIIGTPVPASDISGTFKAMWDTTNLYVLFQITDDVKVNDSINAYDDDAVEVFIDGNYSHGTTYDNVDDVQYVFGWGDTTFSTFGITGHTAGITFAKSDPTGTTYVIEIKIPWTTIGGTASTGRIIGFDGHVDDDDDGGARDNALAYSDTTNIDWTNPSAFAAARLN